MFTKKENLFKGFATLEAWNQAGVKFDLLVLRTSDSIVGFLYDETNDRVLRIRQPRAAMVRDDNPNGIIDEMVAGRFDVRISPKALLVKEAREEAGVEITEDDVEFINDGVPMSLSSGILTERCYGAFAIIHPDKVADGEVFGVPEEGEKIVRYWQSAEDFMSVQHDCWRTWAFAQFLKARKLVVQVADLERRLANLSK